MSQKDFDITPSDANTGVTFRAEVNASLQALASLSSGAGDPSTMYPFQIKIDTGATPNVAYMRRADNTAWVRFGYIDSTSHQLIMDDAANAIDIDNGTVTGQKITASSGSGSYFISGGGYWYPTKGLYMMVDLGGYARVEINSGGWRRSTLTLNGSMFYADGTSVTARIYSASNTTIYWVKW